MESNGASSDINEEDMENIKLGLDEDPVRIIWNPPMEGFDQEGEHPHPGTANRACQDPSENFLGKVSLRAILHLSRDSVFLLVGFILAPQ